VIVLVGALGVDFFDGGEGDLGPAGMLASLGLGGVPVAVVVSLWIAFAWFASFIGTVMLDSAGATSLARMALGTAVIAGATIAGYLATFILVLPLRRIFPDSLPPSLHDLVGQTCIIRTTSVDERHGQAEVTSADGSSAVVQVRHHGNDDGLTAGTHAFIVDYDPDREFFWVAAMPPELSPEI
jgi:hypothetical protein